MRSTLDLQSDKSRCFKHRKDFDSTGQLPKSGRGLLAISVNFASQGLLVDALESVCETDSRPCAHSDCTIKASSGFRYHMAGNFRGG